MPAGKYRHRAAGLVHGSAMANPVVCLAEQARLGCRHPFQVQLESQVNPRRTLAAILLCLAPLAHADPETDASWERGQALARPCTTCHGLDGLRQGGEMPAIGGLDYFYLLYSMSRFRSAERFQPAMTLLLQNFDEADMADVAAYFASVDRSKLARVGPYNVR